jgi:hypothetical protein
MDADTIAAKHEFAVRQYAKAATLAEEVEELFKADYDIPRDQADTATAAAPRVTRPARARAILDKHLTLLSVRATHKRIVVPRDTSHDELEACAKIERWMSGYERQHQWETKKNVWRHFVYWYLLRGRGVLETRYDPTMLKAKRLPIRTYAPDPLTVFPVYGTHGLGYYTKETYVPVWEMRADIERHGAGAKKNRWNQLELIDKSATGPDRAKHDNDTVCLVEYWDDDYCCATVDGELLYSKDNAYGFIPLAEAYCMDTPLASMEWAYQSVLAPIADSLKQIYAIVSKMASSVDLYYYPTILVFYEDGRLEALDGAVVRASDVPRAGVKQIHVISPTTNAPVLQMLLGWLQGDVSLATLPDIAWGAEPASLESGFAISQVLTQVMDKIEDKKTNLEMAYAWDWGHKLRLVQKFGAASGSNLRVPATVKVPTYGY